MPWWVLVASWEESRRSLKLYHLQVKLERMAKCKSGCRSPLIFIKKIKKTCQIEQSGQGKTESRSRAHGTLVKTARAIQRWPQNETNKLYPKLEAWRLCLPKDQVCRTQSEIELLSSTHQANSLSETSLHNFYESLKSGLQGKSLRHFPTFPQSISPQPKREPLM